MSPLHLVFMGVSGTGKSAIGWPVAKTLGCEFAEGDQFHPAANIAKMTGGTALTDEDRRPWLEELAGWTRRHADAGQDTALTCSALRRSYREVLRSGLPGTWFVHLAGDREVIAARMDTRDHFMPPSLLDSQLATLEPLEADEPGTTVDIDQEPELIVEQVLARVRAFRR